ncbi:MAG: flagellar export protein FliJ [Pirellulales bacterium]
MPTYRFRLATLLKLRETTRDERRSQLAEAQRIETLIEEQLHEVEQSMTGLLAERSRSSSPGPINVDRLLDAQRYELTLRSRDRDLRQQLASVRLEVERRRLILAEANREVRVLETLRESQQQQHTSAELTAEQKLLDESALLRYAREEAF